MSNRPLELSLFDMDVRGFIKQSEAASQRYTDAIFNRIGWGLTDEERANIMKCVTVMIDKAVLYGLYEIMKKEMDDVDDHLHLHPLVEEDYPR